MTPFMQAIMGMTLFCICDFITDTWMQRRSAKKCGYNCDACKNWKCHVKYCERKRQEDKQEEEHRCWACQLRDDCPAFNTGVLYPCPHFKEDEHGTT